MNSFDISQADVLRNYGWQSG